MSTVDKRTLKKSKFNFGSPKENYNEYMKNYMKRKFNCECGCVVSISGKSSHLKSNKHKKNLMKLKINEKNNSKENKLIKYLDDVQNMIESIKKNHCLFYDEDTKEHNKFF